MTRARETSENARQAKAWVNFNGSTMEIRSDHNVSTLGDNGLGDYTVNFSSALQDAQYCAVGSVGDSNDGSIIPFVVRMGTYLSSSIRFSTNYASASTQGVYDGSHVNIVLFR